MHQDSPPSTVYYWDLRASRKAPFDVRMRRLLKKTEIASYLTPGDLLALKIHFGEQGSTGFIPPRLVKPFVDFFRKCGSKPFLTDTNTLYTGQRGEAVSHSLQAAEHGFDPNLLGAPVIIADGLKSGNQATVKYPGQHFQDFYLAGDIVEVDRIVNLSHFKGHPLTGFGGAIKNLGMGCASRKGKMQQHCDLAPLVNKGLCQGCGECIRTCSPKALHLDPQGVIDLDENLCTGCAACIHTCPNGALQVNWQVDVQRFLERMLEYAAAVIKTSKSPLLNINFLLHVSPGCDCENHSDSPLCPDIGILASYDPVALDRASLDLVNQATPQHPSRLPQDLERGQDKFLALYNHVPLEHFIDYAKQLDLGDDKYQLLQI
ncbi:MAG: DUF362 domain-containing protein [Thermodesulfobacteriota bacterium]